MIQIGLDPQNIARRVGNVPHPRCPTLLQSVLLGTVGFTFVSVAGFTPWAIFGRPLHSAIGEGGMYAVCALVFIGLSGLALHRLIIGPGSLVRFYKLFALAFGAYAFAWIVGWMSLGGTLGSIVGLLGGTSAMGYLLADAFESRRSAPKIVAALFIPNAAGYFSGGWVENAIASWDGLSLGGHVLLKSTRYMLAMLSWGVCYGAGFGAGLGVAFYRCQSVVRRRLAERSVNAESSG